MARKNNKHKRKAEGDPPTSHFEASLQNQRNPEGSVSNPPQLNNPDAPPPPQRPRASLRSSETAPLSQNRRGLQDANLTSPPPRNLSLLDRIPQNTATISSNSQDSIPQPLNRTVTNAPSSSLRTRRLVLTPSRRAEQRPSGLGGNQPPVETRTVAIPQPSSSSSPLASRAIGTSQQPHPILPPPPSTPGTAEPTTCVVCGQMGSSRKKLTRFPGGGICDDCINFHANANNTGREFVCISGPHRLPERCSYCRYQRCLAAGLPPRDFNSNRWREVGRSRPTQGTSTPLPTRRPRQTPSSSQPIPQIVTRSPSDDRLGTRTGANPLASPSLSPQTSCSSPEESLICQVCNSLKAERFRSLGVIVCNACYYFHNRIMLKKKVKACTGNNNCAIVKGSNPCQSCRYQRCLAIGMRAIDDSPSPIVIRPSRRTAAVPQRPEAMGLLNPFGSPQKRQSTASSHSQPQFLYSETSAFSSICAVCGDRNNGEFMRLHEVNVCEECFKFHKRTNEKKMVYICQTGRLQCPVLLCKSCKYRKCLAVGLPPMDANEAERRAPLTPHQLLREVFLCATEILFDADFTHLQRHEILCDQWRMLLVLASFERPITHEYHGDFKDAFRNWQISAEECAHLKTIALVMKPKTPFGYRFQERFDNEIRAFYTRCEFNGKSIERSINLILWLSDIKHSAPNIPIISDADVEREIRQVLRPF